MYRRLGGPQGRCGQVRTTSSLLGFDPRTVQPVSSRYTNWAIAAHMSSSVVQLKRINMEKNFELEYWNNFKSYLKIWLKGRKFKFGSFLREAATEPRRKRKFFHWYYSVIVSQNWRNEGSMCWIIWNVCLLNWHKILQNFRVYVFLGAFSKLSKGTSRLRHVCLSVYHEDCGSRFHRNLCK